MQQNGIPDMPVVVGGIIPKKDEIFIKELGVKAVFHPYSPLAMIIEQIECIVSEARPKRKTELPLKKKVP